MWRIFLVIFLTGCVYHNDYIGAEYLGASYKTDPLGENVVPDLDPLIRYDTFDCVTFVETSLSGGDIEKLTKIRYKNGIPTVLNRNHFIETDWMENNSDLVVNVSAKFAPTKLHHVTIDKKKWFKTMYNIDTDFAIRNIDLEYIPYNEAHNIHVSKPMIVMFITNNNKIRNKIGTDFAIRHMGFLLPDGRLRHASKQAKHVVDVDFDKYINRIMENKNNLGIMLVEIKK